MEISCTVGFNLDNLLVGLRTQLILRHHIMLNSVLKGAFNQLTILIDEITTKTIESNLNSDPRN